MAEALQCISPTDGFTALPGALPAAQFVLTTDPNVGSLAEALQFIYASLFVELVAKNPLYMPGEPFL